MQRMAGTAMATCGAYKFIPSIWDGYQHMYIGSIDTPLICYKTYSKMNHMHMFTFTFHFLNVLFD